VFGQADSFQGAPPLIDDVRGRSLFDHWLDKAYRFVVRLVGKRHLLRRAQGLLERATRRAVRFPRKVKAFLSDALALRDRRDDGTIPPHGLAVACGRLEKRLDRLLEWKLSHDGNRNFKII